MSKSINNKHHIHNNRRTPDKTFPQGCSSKRDCRQKKNTVGRRTGAWNILVPTVVVFLTALLSFICYPEAIKLMEQQDFFVATRDHFLMSLSDYPALNYLITQWLLQFFANPMTGAVLEALLLALLTLFATLLPIAWAECFRGKAGIPNLAAVIPAFGLIIFCYHSVFNEIEGLFFFFALCVVGFSGRIKARWPQLLGIVLVGLLSLGFVSFPMSALLMATILLLSTPKILQTKSTLWRSLYTLLPLAMIGVVALGVMLWSKDIAFVSFSRRWWNVGGDEDVVLCSMLLSALPVALGFVPQGRMFRLRIMLETTLVLIIAVSIYFCISKNEEKQALEDVLVCRSLAEDAKWPELLDKIKGKGAITNNRDLHFALLAEARLGTLADNLFSYPINTAEEFCPRLEKSLPSVDFCRIFYREMGIYDEAFRRAFEYGMMISRSTGFCFASLRQMAEYCVKQGNKPLAEKYLYLLSRSSCHADFVAEQRRLLENAPTVIDSVRTDNFVKAFPMNKEMAHLLDYDHNNLAVVNYLLCGLLLSKQLEAFKTVLSDYAHVFKGRLPRAYAEAAAMINYLSPGIWAGKITYDPEYDRRFAEYVTLHNNKQDDTAFQGTFWYYYSYASIPPLREWQDQAHDSTT